MVEEACDKLYDQCSSIMWMVRKCIEVKIEKKNDVVRVSVFNTGASNSGRGYWNRSGQNSTKWIRPEHREYGGSGVGLSIVKATMERLATSAYGVENRERRCGILVYIGCFQ